MSITKQKQIDLIEQLVRANEQFSGNEDLLPDFCNEAYSKSYLLFSSVSSTLHLGGYLNKVVTSSMIAILKKTGRFKKKSNNSGRYMSHTAGSGTQQRAMKQKPVSAYDIYEINDPFAAMPELDMDKEDTQKILHLVRTVDSQNRQKKYMSIFYLRYVKCKKQHEIAHELNLQINEVNQRLIELSELIIGNFVY